MDSVSYAYDLMGPHYIALTYLRKRKNTSYNKRNKFYNVHLHVGSK